MTNNNGDCLHIWLITAESDAQLFADLCVMVRRIVARLGGSLENTPESTGLIPRSHHYFAQVHGVDAVSRLSQEMGIHRAQTVPESATDGRVDTALVGVELVPSAGAATTSRPDGPVLKTYNYIQRTVMHHASGQRLELESVLRGDV
jgi:protein subunit release factor A